MAEERIIRFKTTFLLRRGTSEAWQRVNPTLMYGEPGFEKDTYKLKIGDGVTAWNDLAYFGGSFDVSVDGKSITIDNNELALYGFADAAVGQVPCKGEDGKIHWVEPSGDERIPDEEIHEVIDN